METSTNNPPFAQLVYAVYAVYAPAQFRSSVSFRRRSSRNDAIRRIPEVTGSCPTVRPARSPSLTGLTGTFLSGIQACAGLDSPPYRPAQTGSSSNASIGDNRIRE